jgi:glyoxylase-like metal-dependent hydrolase (beta-lactamase superfamily II)
VNDPGWFPRWHPYFRRGVRFEIAADDEIGPRLRALGFDPSDVHTVVLTHLHSDHAGGLGHFPRARILVDRRELDAASGISGRVAGYLSNRWPGWFRPDPISFTNDAPQPFAEGAVVMDGIRVVATPGHTPGHVSVIVEGDPPVFIAGDVSYRLDLMLDGKVDGVAPDEARARDTLARTREFVQRTGAVYLPTHDPHSVDRLAAAGADRGEARR